MSFLVILAMLLVNGIFAGYEMALASISRVRLEVMAQQRRRGSASAIYMKDRLEGSLAVVQIGSTLAGAIAAACGGVAVDGWLTPLLRETFGFSQALASGVSLTLFVVSLSALSIIFGELVPKMVGINHKEFVVLRLSPPMKTLALLVRPAVFLFESAVKWLLRVGRVFLSLEESPAADHAGLLELRAAAALARASRIIGPLEERIVVSAAQLSRRTVAEVMVPAPDIKMIPESASIAEALVEAHIHMHTRYPVCGDPCGVDNIKGYVTFKDIVCSLKLNKTGSGVKGIVRPIRKFNTDMNLAQALAEMIRERLHIVLVAEKGVIRGLLTLEEVVEELVGDIADEYDRLPAQIYPVGGGWLAGGGTTLGDLEKALGGRPFSDSEPHLTLADWIARARRPVRSGDTFSGEGFEVLVRKIRRNRVTEAVIREIPDGWQSDRE